MKICTELHPAPAAKAWNNALGRSRNWNRGYIHIDCVDTPAATDLPEERNVHCNICGQSKTTIVRELYPIEVDGEIVSMTFVEAERFLNGD